MSTRYRISPEGRGPEPGDQEVLRYKDSGKLIHNYQRAKHLLHRRPLYKDPKAFAALIIIVLLAILLSEVVEMEELPAEDPVEQAPR